VGASLANKVYKTASKKLREQPPMCPLLVEKLLSKKLEEQFTEMRRAFRSFDLDHSGSIGKSEFERLLNRYSLYPDKAGLDVLFNRIDPDGSGELGYDEFIEYFSKMLGNNPSEGGGISSSIMDGNANFKTPTGPSRPVKGISAEEAEKLLMNKVADQFGQIGKAFRSYDDDKSGSIGKSEFRRLLTRYCIYMDDHEFERFFARVDPSGEGEVDYQEFIAYFGKNMYGSENGGVGASMLAMNENPVKKHPYSHQRRRYQTPVPEPIVNPMLSKLSAAIAGAKTSRSSKSSGVAASGLVQGMIRKADVEARRPASARSARSNSRLILLSSSSAATARPPKAPRPGTAKMVRQWQNLQ